MQADNSKLKNLDLESYAKELNELIEIYSDCRFLNIENMRLTNMVGVFYRSLDSKEESLKLIYEIKESYPYNPLMKELVTSFFQKHF